MTVRKITRMKTSNDKFLPHLISTFFVVECFHTVLTSALCMPPRMSPFLKDNNKNNPLKHGHLAEAAGAKNIQWTSIEHKMTNLLFVFSLSFIFRKWGGGVSNPVLFKSWLDNVHELSLRKLRRFSELWKRECTLHVCVCVRACACMCVHVGARMWNGLI